MINDIFLPILGAASDDAALDSAIALALNHGARISALITVELPAPLYSEVGFAASEISTKSYNDAREAAQSLADKTRQRLAKANVEADVRIIDASHVNRASMIASQARYSDLTVMGGRDGAGATVTFETLLMQSGRPVIVVPPGVPLSAKPKHVVLAWQASREATRAVHDALPLFESGTQMDVLVVGTEGSEEMEAGRPGERIAEKLSGMGMPARVVAQPRQGRSAGESLLRYLEASGADLLVMGGYGHSRMRELILGGTTQTVLNGLTKPVFFEH
jgi:nucleotide-binding universal stress UspA family protein